MLLNGPSRSSPLAQFVGVLGTVILLTGAFLVGAFVLAVVVGVVVVAGLGLYLRLWWLRRKAMGNNNRAASAEGRIIEGEYVRTQDRDR